MTPRRFLVALAVVMVLLFSLGCEAEGENVTVENKSSEVVVVFEDDVPGALLHPGVTEDFHILRFSGTVTYSVQSFNSRDVLAKRSFTWDEVVRENGITIVIE